jgi:hypothetical protein
MSNPVLIDREDAEALAQNLREHLQYDEDADFKFWNAILTRLETALEVEYES